MTDLNELKKLAEKATPGPWMSYPHPSGHSVCQDAEEMGVPWEDAEHVCSDYDSLKGEGYFTDRPEDLDFIAAANPTTVLDLIARLERAEKALEQAVDAGSLDVVTVVKDASYGMWRYEGVECIVGQSATENFFAGHPEDSPELAAWLKERR